MSTAITNKQQKRYCTQTIEIHSKTSTWKSLVNPWTALSAHVKTRGTEAKILLAFFTKHLHRLPCDRTVAYNPLPLSTPDTQANQKAKSGGSTLVTRAYIKESTYS